MNPARTASPRLSAPALAVVQPRVARAMSPAVPALADFALVWLAMGRKLRCIASAHAMRPGVRLVRRLARLYQVRLGDPASAVAQVVRTRRPLIRTYIQPDTGTPSRESAIAELHRQLAPRSALVVPIVVRDAVVGALSLCYSQSGRSYRASDVRAADRIAARIARALTSGAPRDAALRLRTSARDARLGTTVRRRVAARN